MRHGNIIKRKRYKKMASYLYLKNRLTNTDNRPVVALVEGIQVPQYPIKASELDLVFSDIGNVDMLTDLGDTIKDAVDAQQEEFKRVVCERYGVSYCSAVFADMEKQRLSSVQPKSPHVDLYSALWASYYRSYYDTDTTVYIDDLWVMFAQWRVNKLQTEYPKLAEGIDRGIFYVCYNGLFYITANYERLYAYDMFTGDAEEASNTDNTADNICDVTQCIWESLQEYLGLNSGSYSSFRDWAVEQKNADTIADIISEMLWGFSDCAMIKEIGKL